MAFNRSNNTAADTSTVATGTFKKADAFINIYATDAEGKSHKVGSLALHKDNALHAAMIEHCESAEDAVFDVMSSLTCDFRSAVPVVNKAVFSFKKAA